MRVTVFEPSLLCNGNVELNIYTSEVTRDVIVGIKFQTTTSMDTSSWATLVRDYLGILPSMFPQEVVSIKQCWCVDPEVELLRAILHGVKNVKLVNYWDYRTVMDDVCMYAEVESR